MKASAKSENRSAVSFSVGGGIDGTQGFGFMGRVGCPAENVIRNNVRRAEKSIFASSLVAPNLYLYEMRFQLLYLLPRPTCFTLMAAKLCAADNVA